MKHIAWVICVALFIYFSKRIPKRRRTVPPLGERVLLVGCSSGIGRDLAKAYAARGAVLVLFARRGDLLASLKSECLHLGSPNVVIVTGNVCERADVAHVVAMTRQHLGGVDTVVYCAGVISVCPFLEGSGVEVTKVHGKLHVKRGAPPAGDALMDALDHITRVNYTAAVWTAQAVLPLLMETSNAPNLMVLSSMAGKVGAPTRALYAGSKHALHGFFDSLRVEVAPFGVHIGMICPGTVDTELRKTAVDGALGKSGAVAGTTHAKLQPRTVAKRIIKASDRREREVYLPSWFGHGALWAKLLASTWVDRVAKRKYKLPLPRDGCHGDTSFNSLEANHVK